MRIVDEIFLLDGAGIDANVYCINGEVLVDTGSGLFVKETLEQMEKYGIDKDKIEKIVLTHEHFDHTGAAKRMKEETGAKILAFKDAEMDSEANLSSLYEEEINPGDEDFEAPDVDEYLEEGDVISTSDHEFEVIHTPGHSPGHISLWNQKEKILIAGDVLFIDGFGRTDIPGGDQGAMEKSLKRIKELGDIEVLLPGHGTPGSEENIYGKDAIDKILAEI
ncbi:MAG: MBL fold metallo-hydrolase [Candidatus Aenigmatarchaeota archaeon]